MFYLFIGRIKELIGNLIMSLSNYFQKKTLPLAKTGHNLSPFKGER